MFCWTVHQKVVPKKAYHAAVAVRNKVYSFGVHCVYHVGQISVHVFNTVSLRWMKFPPVTTGSGERPHEVPSRRCGHTAVLIEDVIYIWGGFKYFTGGYCNILYALDTDTHRWFMPNVSGTVPEARYNHTACVLGKVMYIYGGWIELTGRSNDIYTLDTDSMVWSLINTRGPLAPSSERHSAIIIGTKMFVFGGYNDNYEYNNIRVFDTEINFWLTTPSAQRPQGRAGHSAFAYNGELYIFGGYNLDWRFNDLWKFNPKTFSWKKVEPKGKGPCSWMPRMCCCMVGDRIIIFGEYIPDDLYILDLRPSLKTLCKLAVIQYGLEQSGLPHDVRWELAAMTANSPQNKIQTKNGEPPEKKRKTDENSRELAPDSGSE